MKQKSHYINKNESSPLSDAKQESEKNLGRRFVLRTLSFLAHCDQLGNSVYQEDFIASPGHCPLAVRGCAELSSDAHRSGCKDRQKIKVGRRTPYEQGSSCMNARLQARSSNLLISPALARTPTAKDDATDKEQELPGRLPGHNAQLITEDFKACVGEAAGE